MIRRKVAIASKVGLHARPAAAFVSAASRFERKVTLEYDDKRVNGKSILQVLSLGVGFGEQVTVIVQGNDETEALEELTQLLSLSSDE